GKPAGIDRAGPAEVCPALIKEGARHDGGGTLFQAQLEYARDAGISVAFAVALHDFEDRVVRRNDGEAAPLLDRARVGTLFEPGFLLTLSDLVDGLGELTPHAVVALD